LLISDVPLQGYSRKYLDSRPRALEGAGLPFPLSVAITLLWRFVEFYSSLSFVVFWGDGRLALVIHTSLLQPPLPFNPNFLGTSVHSFFSISPASPLPLNAVAGCPARTAPFFYCLLKRLLSRYSWSGHLSLLDDPLSTHPPLNNHFWKPFVFVHHFPVTGVTGPARVVFEFFFCEPPVGKSLPPSLFLTEFF